MSIYFLIMTFLQQTRSCHKSLYHVCRQKMFVGNSIIFNVVVLMIIIVLYSLYLYSNSHKSSVCVCVSVCPRNPSRPLREIS